MPVEAEIVRPSFSPARHVRRDKLESVSSHCSQVIECRRRYSGHCGPHRSVLMAAASFCCIAVDFSDEVLVDC